MSTRIQSRRTAAFVLLAVAAFAGVCTAVQFLRPDLDWARVPLSFYLIGPYMAPVRAVYVLLGLALGALGLAWHRALVPPARSAAPALLFVLAGMALIVTAFAATNTWAHPATLHGFVHGVAAQTAFLCVTVAMLLLGWRLRQDRHWRALHGPAFGGAVVLFAGMWVQALWRSAPRGASQKRLILALLAWLAGMAWALWRKNPEESFISD